MERGLLEEAERLRGGCREGSPSLQEPQLSKEPLSTPPCKGERRQRREDWQGDPYSVPELQLRDTVSRACWARLPTGRRGPAHG